MENWSLDRIVDLLTTMAVMLFKYFWQCNLLIPVLPLSEPVAKTEQWRHHNRRSEAGGPHSGWSHSCRGTHLAPEADHPRQLGSGQCRKFWLWRHLYYFLKMDQFYQFFEITFISLYNQAKINIHYIPSVEVLCFVFDGKFQLPMWLHNSCMQSISQPGGGIWRKKINKISRLRGWRRLFWLSSMCHATSHLTKYLEI